MSTYLPTIKQLQYLVALHEHGHFGRAAEASFVSQSTLSAGIRELETLLEDGDLIARCTRRRGARGGEHRHHRRHRCGRHNDENLYR